MQNHKWRLWPFCIVVQFLITDMHSPVLAFKSSSEQNELLDYYKRQYVGPPAVTVPLPVASTSTSSFNWWPYPPAGASTSPIATTALPTSTDVDSADPGDTALLTNTTSSATSDSLSSSEASSSSADSSTQASTFSSSPPIRITALPPLPSSMHIPHRVSAYQKPINPLLFTPLFAVLGAGFGFAIGWFAYGYWKRRREARSEGRLAGPRYVGVEANDDEKFYVDADKFAHEDANSVIAEEEELTDNPHLSKTYNSPCPAREDIGTVHQDEEPLLVSAWSRLGLSALLTPGLVSNNRARTNTAPVYQGGNQSSRFGGRSIEEGSADDLRSPYAATVFSSVATSDEEDDDYEGARHSAIRRGNVRHRSFRKRLAEKLRLQFSPGRGFGRKTSWKGSIKCGRTPELEQGVFLPDDSPLVDSPTASDKGLSKRKSRPGSTRLGHGRTNSDFSAPINEIRTPPKVYTLRDPGVVSAISDHKNVSAFSTPPNTEDRTGVGTRYTPLPIRKVRSGRKLVSERSTRRWRPEVLDDSIESPKFGVYVDRRVLPTSPPILRSPDLESSLFFGSSVNVSRPGSNIARSAKNEDREDLRRPKHQQESPIRSSAMRKGPSGPRQPNKLLSTHSPSNVMHAPYQHPLPSDNAFPSTSLRRSTARSSSCSPRKEEQGRERANTVSSVPMAISPKQRYEAWHTALDKVDAIVERSWSARLSQGSLPPSSPTMFGAYSGRDSTYRWGS